MQQKTKKNFVCRTEPTFGETEMGDPGPIKLRTISLRGLNSNHPNYSLTHEIMIVKSWSSTWLLTVERLLLEHGLTVKKLLLEGLHLPRIREAMIQFQRVSDDELPVA